MGVEDVDPQEEGAIVTLGEEAPGGAQPGSYTVRRSGGRAEPTRQGSTDWACRRGVGCLGQDPRSVALVIDPAKAAVQPELRAGKRILCSERGVPAYVILTDATLRQLARHKPRDKAELADIHGIGAHKLDDLGEMILEVIGVRSAPEESQ